MDDEYYASKRPIRYLSTIPFPDLDLTIDGGPVRIITGFSEDTDQRKLTLADCVATALWSWHPNALRAFLDFNRFKNFSWDRRAKRGS